MKVIILKGPWYINLFNGFLLTQNNEEGKSNSIPVAAFISWTIAMCWLSNIQPHSEINTSVTYSSPHPTSILGAFIHFSSIFLNEKIYFSSYPLIGYTDPQQRNYLPVHFLPIMSNPVQRSSLLPLSKLSCLLLSILARWHFHGVASAPDKYTFPAKSVYQRLLLSDRKILP